MQFAHRIGHPRVARLGLRRHDFCEFLLNVKIVIRDFEHIIKKAIQFVRRETDIEEKIRIERLQEFLVPRAHIFI